MVTSPLHLGSPEYLERMSSPDYSAGDDSSPDSPIRSQPVLYPSAVTTPRSDQQRFQTDVSF